MFLPPKYLHCSQCTCLTAGKYTDVGIWLPLVITVIFGNTTTIAPTSQLNVSFTLLMPTMGN